MLRYACVTAVPAYAWTHLEIGVLAGLQNIVIGSGVDSREVKTLTYKTAHAIQLDNGKPRFVSRRRAARYDSTCVRDPG